MLERSGDGGDIVRPGRRAGDREPPAHAAAGSRAGAGGVMLRAQGGPVQCALGRVTELVPAPQCPHCDRALSNRLPITGLVQSWTLSGVSSNRAGAELGPLRC